MTKMGLIEWNREILQSCIRNKICVPYDRAAAKCKYNPDGELLHCSYLRCPRLRMEEFSPEVENVTTEIPDEHMPAVDYACQAVIWAAYSSCADPSDMMTWVRDAMDTRYKYPEPELSTEEGETIDLVVDGGLIHITGREVVVLSAAISKLSAIIPDWISEEYLPDVESIEDKLYDFMSLKLNCDDLEEED